LNVPTPVFIEPDSAIVTVRPVKRFVLDVAGLVSGQENFAFFLEEGF
jgi:hypothetical protein